MMPKLKQIIMSVLSEVMGNVNDSNENLNKIEDSLFDVVDSPKVAPVEGWEKPKGKEIYTSEGIWIGSVGNTYETLQPKDFFNAVVDNVRDTGMEFDLAKLEYNLRADGRSVEFRLPTNIVSFKNAAGKQDETKMFLNFVTGLAGYGATEVGLYSHRLICVNGMKIINSDIALKFKHTTKMNVKALTFAQEIINTASQVEATSQVWSEMNNVQIDTATKESFVRKLANMKKAELYSELSTKKQNIYDNISEAMAVEFGQTGSTVWGLLNGTTRYTNHYAAGASEEYILNKTGAKTNKKAQELALELI